jgi:hypothetical protein
MNAMARIIVVGAFGIALAGAIIYFITAWSSVGSAEISAAGWAAIFGGALVTLAVGGGLMALVFYSARRGYDEIDRHE